MTDLRIVSLTRSRISDAARIEKECFSSPWSEESLGLLLTGENGGLLALDGECATGYIGYLGVVDDETEHTEILSFRNGESSEVDIVFGKYTGD